jgi:hypothetical protein
VETAAHARRAGKTTFFRHQAMTARTGAGNLAVASVDALPPPRLGPCCFVCVCVPGVRCSAPRSALSLLTALRLWLPLRWLQTTAVVYGEEEREKQQAALVGWFVTAVLLALPPSAADPSAFWPGVRAHLSSRPFAVRCLDVRSNAPRGQKQQHAPSSFRHHRPRAPVATRGGQGIC